MVNRLKTDEIPCPTSRRFSPPRFPTSLMENGGKL